ncbi:MAG: 23S rRNA (adenine(1618)-N(6))-methyltransferase [Bacteroidetes bacterium B1(2017)]|nr:MAG: 23S rRNA (adenine(1618)-N(6))-methyltransferase [Bacteroidetes bacterium B1(2017)]
MTPEKTNLHPRNAHRNGYDFTALSITLPALKEFVGPNKYGNLSIDFANPKAVKCLNAALLKQFYKVDGWDIPEGYLCPPIPGRADYVHSVADILQELYGSRSPLGSKVQVLDIGTGSNLVYPLIGSSIYNWNFVGTETDEVALKNGNEILAKNPHLAEKIKLRKQIRPTLYFKGMIQEGEHFDITMCNPPFHASEEEARAVAVRKVSNLAKKLIEKPVLNFGGSSHELWCRGGETQFVLYMMMESQQFANQCLWFTTLISKGNTLPELKEKLESMPIYEYRLVEMSQGQKISRFLAWTFQNPDKQAQWRKMYW